MDKNKSDTNDLIAAAVCSAELSAPNTDNTVWVQITPAGAFSAIDQRLDYPWYIDTAVASAVIEKFNERKNPAVVDYEHQTLNAKTNGQPAPAAGWLKQLQWREGAGLFGLIQLTAAAAKSVTAGEYRYFSPVFYHDHSGKVIDVIMGALTNYPAIDGMAALQLQAAASALFSKVSTKEKSMSEQLKKALGLDASASDEQVAGAVQQLQQKLAEQNNLVSKIAKELGLTGSNITEEQVAAATAQLKQPIDTSKHVPVEAVQQLQQQLAALTAQVQTKEVDTLIEQAVASGKLLPAMVTWAQETGKTNPQALKSFLASAVPVAALTGTQGTTPPDGSQLSADEQQAAKLLGIAEADYLKTKGV